MAANQLLENGGTKPNKDVPTPVHVMVRLPHTLIHHTGIDSVLRDNNNSAIVTNAI